MANRLKVVLNTGGVRSMLKSEEMRAICAEHASTILGRCGDGYETESYVAETRAVATVYAATPAARADNIANNTILKAVGGG